MIGEHNFDWEVNDELFFSKERFQGKSAKNIVCRKIKSAKEFC